MKQFKFFLEIWAYVEEWCGGYRLYRFIVQDFGSSDYSGYWNRQWLGSYGTFDSNPGGHN